MPGWCSAYSCSNERTVKNRNQGITFHKFPKDKVLRKKWELALRKKGFTAGDYSVVCSQHFKQADFDRTGQIVRLRDGVVPSLFNFPAHLQKLIKQRATSTSRRAAESLPVASKVPPVKASIPPKPQPTDDHGYALPASPAALKAKFNEHLARVEILEREKKNAESREKRARRTAMGLLGDLREMNLMNEELTKKLAFYSDLQMDFMANQGNEYTQDFREFALALHLHGPKAYKYLRESRHFPLPHPNTLQRWLHSVHAKPELNKTMLDLLESRCQGDQDNHECVPLMLDDMAVQKLVQATPHTESESGFIDAADGNSETDVASKALVFMMVDRQGQLSEF